MNRGDAYKLLATRLEELRGDGYDSLLKRIGQPAASETVRVNGEDVVVDVAVFWADSKPRTLRVCATASGPSAWMMERLDESFVIAQATRPRHNPPLERTAAAVYFTCGRASRVCRRGRSTALRQAVKRDHIVANARRSSTPLPHLRQCREPRSVFSWRRRVLSKLRSTPLVVS